MGLPSGQAATAADAIAETQVVAPAFAAARPVADLPTTVRFPAKAAGTQMEALRPRLG
jgi:hypothetical protein